MRADLQQEIARREAAGCERLSVAGMAERFARLGYRLDRSLDCHGVARLTTTGGESLSYPCVTTGVKESDSGLSAFNVGARRDDTFRAMQELRQTVYAVSRGAILEA
jgi:hypothetical protein